MIINNLQHRKVIKNICFKFELLLHCNIQSYYNQKKYVWNNWGFGV
jgi:hypothetical protein